MRYEAKINMTYKAKTFLFYILKPVQNCKDKAIHVAFIFLTIRSFTNGYMNSLCISTYSVKRYAAMLPDKRHPLPRPTL
jgi:hypothetical protein